MAVQSKHLLNQNVSLLYRDILKRIHKQHSGYVRLEMQISAESERVGAKCEPEIVDLVTEQT